MPKITLSTICAITGCDRGGKIKRGMCAMHYSRAWYRGELAPIPAASTADRLASGLVARPSGCIEWVKTRGRGGYGYFVSNGVRISTHRIAWELLNGPIPDGLLIRHSCDNPPCCNPAHLSPGTVRDNAADMIAHGRGSNQRKTHCSRNHEYSIENTFVRPNGYRECRTCQKAYSVRRAIRNAIRPHLTQETE